MHRLLVSLVEGGLVERVGKEQFRSKVLSLAERRFRVGFATQARGSTFSQMVQDSVQRAAAEHGIDLVVVDNRYSPRTALRNSDRLIKEKVDLVIEFQTHERVATMISSRFLEAGIPVIAVEVPHPGATYFGADNYHAGRLGGRALAKWARRHWHSHVEEVLLIAETVAGPLPHLRLTGMLSGIQEMLPKIPADLVTELDGKGAM
ncbi:MAG: sugar ABC transporter substrate-binding protein, partial [bacterium]|nr:sugar ABC transporter substrate-binding protein [bacterium]